MVKSLINLFHNINYSHLILLISRQFHEFHADLLHLNLAQNAHFGPLHRDNVPARSKIGSESSEEGIVATI